MDDRLYRGNLGVCRQGGEARPDDRLTSNHAVLFGPVAASAQPAPGCDDHRCHHANHLVRVRK
jgi:hypothetical protein